MRKVNLTLEEMLDFSNCETMEELKMFLAEIEAEENKTLSCKLEHIVKKSSIILSNLVATGHILTILQKILQKNKSSKTLRFKCIIPPTFQIGSTEL